MRFRMNGGREEDRDFAEITPEALRKKVSRHLECWRDFSESENR